MREILLLISLVMAFVAGYLLGLEQGALQNATNVSMKIVAVGYTGDGILADLKVTLRPGNGNVYVSLEPKVEIDTQSSAETAVYIAQRLAKIPLGMRDVLIEIKAPSKVVEGPSAGAAMAVAVYGALIGKNPRKDVVITGTVDSYGRVGKVGGLLEKLRACAKNGIKVFLIPKGQRYVEIYEPFTKGGEVFPGVYIVKTTYKRKVIDLYEEGKKLGVEVHEVSTIKEALKYFYG